jgi:crossover junction endodeoxyribonuclease RuvC
MVAFESGGAFCMASGEYTVVGFDPGTAVTGWAAVTGPKSPKLIRAGAIRAKANRPIEQRLQAIYEGVTAILDEYHPQIVAVEDPFVGKNPSGALTLGQARGVILLAVAQEGCNVVSYSPATIKASVAGKGSADKEQVRQMVMYTLGLTEVPEPLDASDAIAVALCQINRGVAPLAGSGTSGGKDDTATSSKSRAEKLAVREEDAEALAKWLSGGRGK